jgi:hypothetical protein
VIMAQDDLSVPTVAEEPQASEQSDAMRVDAASAQTTVESQMAEPATDAAEDEGTEDERPEEEEASEDAGHDEAMATEPSPQGDAVNVVPASSATPPTPSTPDADADDRSEIEKQPYAFELCTVQIALQLLPDDGDPNGRMVVVGVRSHLDAPILHLVHLNEVGTLPPIVNALLDELKVELPTREHAAREAFEKKKEEKAKRKATVTASKTARGKKTKATLSTAPAASNAPTDHRPRPEVQATAAPQQQMGLF